MNIIFTSYLSNVAKLNKMRFKPIFIASRWPSNIQLFDEYKVLAPSLKLIGSYIRKEITEEEYTPIYCEYLSTLTPSNVISDLYNFCRKKESPVLICYEKPGDFCHRHLVSDWLNENGFICTEYGSTIIHPMYF